MSESKHTAWRAAPKGRSRSFGVLTAEGGYVGEFLSAIDRDIAVSAANCHDELVNAIGEYLALFDRMAAGHEVSPIELANARCAMRDAKRKAEAAS